MGFSRRTFLASTLALAACGDGPAMGSDEIAARLRAFEDQTAQLRPVPALPRTQPAPGLRGLTGIPVGACMLPDKLEEPGYGELISTQFSQLTPEWNFQLPAVMQDDGSYDWTWPDRIVEFALAHNQRIHGTSLVWYQLDEAPALQRLDGDRPAFAAAFRQNILTIAGRYRAVTRSWDVVNEPVAEDGDGLRDSLWSRNLGAEEYMVAAFEAAAEAAPEAVLFVNDYNLELLPAKRASFMRLVDRLRARDVPVGGIGTQTHLHADTPPGLVTTAMAELASLGLPIHVSEFDVKFGRVGQSPLTLDQKLAIQEGLAAETAAAFMALPPAQRHAFTVWGARDRDSNLNRAQWGGDGADVPLLFDNQGQPKPAFWAVADRLASA